MTNNVESLLDELDEVREQLLVAIADLPDEALTRSHAVGRYAISDILVNLTIWEAELVTGLMRVDQGKKPSRLLEALANRQAFNQKRYLENVGRDLDRVFDDLQQVRVQLESWLDTIPERALFDSKRYSWLGGRSLASLIREITVENELKYVPLIQAYVNQMASSNGHTGNNNE